MYFCAGMNYTVFPMVRTCCLNVVLKSFGHVEIKEILSVGEITSHVKAHVHTGLNFNRNPRLR